MRKTILIYCLLLVIFNVSIPSIAQQKNIIKINLISPVVRTGSFFFERVINPEMSFQLGGFITGYAPKAINTKFNGFGITPEFRYYLSSIEAPEGFYLGPFLRYQSFTAKNTSSNSSSSVSFFGGGLLIGHQWIFKERVSLDLFFGPSYSKMFNLKIDNGNQKDFNFNPFNGIGFRTGITIGVAF